jgi:hypothetical protein
LYLGDLERYIRTAKTSAELSDKILTALFSVTDYTDLLSLTKVDDCSRYVWVTAQAFDTLFERLQVQPVLGQAQEVRFVTTKKVVPAPGTAAAAERNKLCINVAYVYIRIFQIYAALALTVMEANPTRLRISMGVPGASSAAARPKGQFLMGDGSAPRQRGGASPSGAALERIGIFKFIKEFLRQNNTEIIEFVADGKTALGTKHDRSFYFNSKEVQSTADTSIVPAKWSMKGRRDIDITVSIRATEPNVYQLSINGTDVETYIYSQSLVRTEVVQSNYPNDPEALLDSIQSVIGVEIVPGAARQAALGSTGYGSYGTTGSYGTSGSYGTAATAPFGAAATAPFGAAAAASAPFGVATAAPRATASSGTNLFQGYANVRKVFTDYRPTTEGRPTATAGFFPKAYCVARAMTLLTPLFDSERTNKNQPFYTQICRRTLDFEDPRYPLMPRTGTTPKANIYLKSLVALYYDDYTVTGGQVVGTQSETGRSELRSASALLAKLYRVPPSTTGENFIESGSQFRGTSICGATAMQTSTSLIHRIKEDNIRRKIQTEIIQPMLVLQDQHAARVNSLLKEMIQLKPDGGFKFSAAIVNGGRQAVNDFGRRARAMLLDYYLKSEAFYIKGVIEFEKNATGLEAVIG